MAADIRRSCQISHIPPPYHQALLFKGHRQTRAEHGRPSTCRLRGLQGTVHGPPVATVPLTSPVIRQNVVHPTRDMSRFHARGCPKSDDAADARPAGVH